MWLLWAPPSWRLYGHPAVVVIRVRGCYASEVSALGVIVVVWLLQVFWLLRPQSEEGAGPWGEVPS